MVGFGVEGKPGLPIFTWVASIERESSVMNTDAREWYESRPAAQCSRERRDCKQTFLSEIRVLSLSYCFSITKNNCMVFLHCKRRHEYSTGDYEELFEGLCPSFSSASCPAFCTKHFTGMDQHYAPSKCWLEQCLLIMSDAPTAGFLTLGQARNNVHLC